MNTPRASTPSDHTPVPSGPELTPTSRWIAEFQASQEANAILDPFLDLDLNLNLNLNMDNPMFGSGGGQKRRFEGDDNDDDNGVTQPPALRPAVWRDLSVQAAQLSAAKHLRPTAAGDLFQYATSRDDERALQLMACLLQVRDVHEKAEEDVEYVLPDGLKDNCTKFAHAILLSPILASYRLGLTNHVIDLIAKLAGNQLPDMGNPHRVAILRTAISDAATAKRYKIKTAIIKSLAHKDCIELLCKTILAPTEGVEMTEAFCARVAFLRKIYVENPKHQGDPYWAFVDNKLLKLREQLPSALMLAAAFNKALVDDRALYENGNKALYKIVSPLAIPKFQSDVEKAILAVQQTVTIGTGGLTAPGGSRGGSAGGGSGAPS